MYYSDLSVQLRNLAVVNFDRLIVRNCNLLLTSIYM